MSEPLNETLPEEWVDLINNFQQLHSDAQAMGRPEKLEKRSAAGLLNARERVELLVDPGSFNEIGTLVGMVEHQGLPAAPADALVGGTATIDGRPVVVGSEDATVQGGSIGIGTHAKRMRLASIAHRERVPLVMLLDGAGERVTNALQRHPYAPNDMQEMAALSHKVPTIAAVMGASAGHGAITGLLSDIVIMVQDGAIFSAGPPLVAEALGEIISKEDLGGASVHAFSGVVHNIAAGEREALDMIRDYLSYLPTNAWQYPPAQENSQDCGPRKLNGILHSLPRDGKQAYDIREIIQQLVDRNEFRQFNPDFGPSIITGFARLGGQSIAIVANQPSVMAGSITRDAADKAAYFIDLANAYHLPVIFLADNPGIMSGSAAEKIGTLRSAAGMYRAQCKLSTPKLHVTLRKAYGFGSSLMGMNPFDKQTISYAFPGIALGGVPASSGGTAAKMRDEERAFMIQMEREGWSKAADSLAYDEVIDPRDLRSKLLAGLRLSTGRLTEAPKPKH
ncbi:MAG: carboxyl transferase domain-containing protein [Pseudomonadales bacterium]